MYRLGADIQGPACGLTPPEFLAPCLLWAGVPAYPSHSASGQLDDPPSPSLSFQRLCRAVSVLCSSLGSGGAATPAPLTWAHCKQKWQYDRSAWPDPWKSREQGAGSKSSILADLVLHQHGERSFGAPRACFPLGCTPQHSRIREPRAAAGWRGQWSYRWRRLPIRHLSKL